MPKVSFNKIIYLIIFLVFILNYLVMMGTLKLISGTYWHIAALDLLRADSSFFLFIALLSSCFLIESPRLLWSRRVLVALLVAFTLTTAYISAVIAQITSEAGPMHKVLFYVNYLSSDWLTDSLFKIIILYLFPLFILSVSAGIYYFCLLYKKNDTQHLRKSFQLRFVLAIIALFIGFTPPLQNQIPYSLSHNTLFYFLKTGYFPKEDIVSHDRTKHYQHWQVSQKDSVSDELSKKNIVLIILESTQFKAIQIGENAKYPDLTPHLNQLAKQSLVFTQAYGSVPHTSKALTGIHCGILPVLDLPIYASVYGLPVKCLPKLLSEKGYANVYMQNATDKYENRRELLTQFGYQDIYSAERFKGSTKLRGNPLGFEDLVLVDGVEAWLDNNANTPYLMTLLNLTTHHPYTQPAGFQKKYYTDKRIENNYLNSVSYMDSYIKQLMDVFKNNEQYLNTLFIFVSDHGEAFGEHGEQMHNNVAYNEVAQVFFMIFDPSQTLPTGVQKNTVSHLQVLPTVFDILNDPVKPIKESYQMSSVLQETGKAFGSCYERFMCFFYAANDYKYIFNFTERPPELFHIKNDPQEKHNLVKEKPDIAERMHKQLMQYYTFHQSAIHNYYLEQNPNYDREYKKVVLYRGDDMYESLKSIWPEE